MCGEKKKQNRSITEREEERERSFSVPQVKRREEVTVVRVN